MLLFDLCSDFVIMKSCFVFKKYLKTSLVNRNDQGLEILFLKKKAFNKFCQNCSVHLHSLQSFFAPLSLLCVLYHFPCLDLLGNVFRHQTFREFPSFSVNWLKTWSQASVVPAGGKKNLFAFIFFCTAQQRQAVCQSHCKYQTFFLWLRCLLSHFPTWTDGNTVFSPLGH